MNRCIGELSTDTRILMNLIELKLLKEKQGVLTYIELTAAIHRNVQDEAAGILATARRNVMKENNIIIETVRMTGIKLSRDYSGTLDAARTHIRRTATHTMKRVVRAITADTAITKGEMVTANARLSALGAIVLFTTSSANKQLEAKVQENQCKELPTADALKLFQSK